MYTKCIFHLVLYLQMTSMLATVLVGVTVKPQPVDASLNRDISGLYPPSAFLARARRICSAFPGDCLLQKSDLAGKIDHSLESVVLAIHQLGLFPRSNSSR